jgi:phenylacetate-CoA ligase
MTMFSEAIRRYGFWCVDAIGGGQVRQYVLDLEKKMHEKSDVSSDDLRNLLDHAVNTTEFYGKFKGYSSITDFPIIKKNLVKEKYDQFMSSDSKNKPLHKTMTSGSTGERFIMLQDGHKRKRVIAELIYFLKQCGFRLGYKHVYARIWSEDVKKTKVVLMAHNTIMFDCSSLSAKSMDILYQMLHKGNSVKCLTGYATFLEAIAIYFEKKGYTPDLFDLKVVISGAERLELRAKTLLKKVFGCTVVSRYGNWENGFLAQQTNAGDNFILNTAHYFFETLKLDSDKPAPYGESARLVLTDLYNYAMPLIRYDTGDIVIAGVSGNGGSAKMLLTELSGRKDDVIYDTQGNKISPHFIAQCFRRYDKLPQFQLVQNNLKQFTLKLEGVSGLYDNDDFQNTIKTLVGSDAIVEIEHVDKIPHLSSGKFRKIICNYKGLGIL